MALVQVCDARLVPSPCAVQPGTEDEEAGMDDGEGEGQGEGRGGREVGGEDDNGGSLRLWLLLRDLQSSLVAPPTESRSTAHNRRPSFRVLVADVSVAVSPSAAAEQQLYRQRQQQQQLEDDAADGELPVTYASLAEERVHPMLAAVLAGRRLETIWPRYCGNQHEERSRGVVNGGRGSSVDTRLGGRWDSSSIGRNGGEEEEEGEGVQRVMLLLDILPHSGALPLSPQQDPLAAVTWLTDSLASLLLSLSPTSFEPAMTRLLSTLLSPPDQGTLNPNPSGGPHSFTLLSGAHQDLLKWRSAPPPLPMYPPAQLSSSLRKIGFAEARAAVSHHLLTTASRYLEALGAESNNLLAAVSSVLQGFRVLAAQYVAVHEALNPPVAFIVPHCGSGAVGSSESAVVVTSSGAISSSSSGSSCVGLVRGHSLSLFRSMDPSEHLTLHSGLVSALFSPFSRQLSSPFSTLVSLVTALPKPIGGCLSELLAARLGCSRAARGASQGLQAQGRKAPDIEQAESFSRALSTCLGMVEWRIGAAVFSLLPQLLTDPSADPLSVFRLLADVVELGSLSRVGAERIPARSGGSAAGQRAFPLRFLHALSGLREASGGGWLTCLEMLHETIGLLDLADGSSYVWKAEMEGGGDEGEGVRGGGRGQISGEGDGMRGLSVHVTAGGVVQLLRARVDLLVRLLPVLHFLQQVS